MKIKEIYWRLFIIRLSLRWILSNCLGDRVRYRGKEYILTQGVCDPLWNLLSDDGERLEFVHHDHFYKIASFKNYIGSFRAGYGFYMTSWYRIWLRGGIKPWTRGCRIWKIQENNPQKAPAPPPLVDRWIPPRIFTRAKGARHER